MRLLRRTLLLSLPAAVLAPVLDAAAYRKPGHAQTATPTSLLPPTPTPTAASTATATPSSTAVLSASPTQGATPTMTYIPGTGGGSGLFNVEDPAYGATGNGSTNDSAAIQAAIDAAFANGGGTLFFPGGTYICSDLAWKDRVSAIGYGATLKKPGGLSSSSQLINLLGVAGASTTLTANAAPLGTALTVTSTTGFVVGDIVLLQDNSYAYGAGTAARNLELNRVAAVPSGTSITLSNRMISSYTTANTATIYRLSTKVSDLSIIGLTLINPTNATANGSVVLMDLCYNVAFRDCNVVGPFNYAGFDLSRSAWCKFEASGVRDGQGWTIDNNYGFGFKLQASCHNIKMVDCRTEYVEQNSITDNCRYVEVTNCMDIGAFDNAWNTHGSGNKHVTFTNCHSVSAYQYGFAVGHSTQSGTDEDITLVGCTTINSGSHGIVVGNNGATHNKRVSIEGCTVRNPSIRVGSSNGIQIGAADMVQVIGNKISGNNAANISNAVALYGPTQCLVLGNNISNMTNSYGIYMSSGSDTTIQSNIVYETSTPIWTTATPTNVSVLNNVVLSAMTIGAGTVSHDNMIAGTWTV